MWTIILTWLHSQPEQVGVVCGAVASFVIGRLILWPRLSWLTPDSTALAKGIGAVLAALVTTAIAEGLAAATGGAFDWGAVWAAFTASITATQILFLLWKLIAKRLGLEAVH